MKNLVAFLCIFGLAWLAPAQPGLGRGETSVKAEAGADRSTNAPFTADREVHYTMTARIRLLIPWLSFKNVGMGRIRWSSDTARPTSIELLIGSDPQTAPMKINRWGYLLEQSTKSGFEQIGVMTQSDEDSMQEARKNLERKGGTHNFKTIRCRIENGTAESVTHLVPSDRDFTFRDLEELLQMVPGEGGNRRRITLPEDSLPGFLSAVMEMTRKSVEELHRSGSLKASQGSKRGYAFNGHLYQLTLVSSRHRRSFEIEKVRYQDVIESEYRILRDDSRKPEEFKIIYGTRDALSGVPLRIVYRPKWWFEAWLQIVAPAKGV